MKASDGANTKRSKTFRVEAVGGVRYAEATFDGPGVYVVRGPNGGGKTSFIRAITKTLGADTPVEVRDGEPAGRVVGPGVTLNIRQVARASGKAEVQLADCGPLARLIDPPVKGVEPRARERIAALCALVGLPLTQGAAETLCTYIEAPTGAAGGGGKPTRTVDVALVQWLLASKPADVLAAAELLREQLQERARQAETDRDRWAGLQLAASGEIDHAEEEIHALGSDGLPEPDVEAAEAKAQVAALAYERVMASAAVRQDAEFRMRAIREGRGERPDIDVAKAVAAEAMAALEDQEALTQEARDTAARLTGKADALRTKADAGWDALARPVQDYEWHGLRFGEVWAGHHSSGMLADAAGKLLESVERIKRAAGEWALAEAAAVAAYSEASDASTARAAAETKLLAAHETADAANRAAENAAQAAAVWDRQTAEMDKPVSGATEDEMRAAKGALDGANYVVKVHAASARLRAAQKKEDETVHWRETATERATALRQAAKDVHVRVAECLAARGVDELTVTQGRLHWVDAAGKGPDGTAETAQPGALWDFETRLSDGQRVAIALRVAARALGSGPDNWPLLSLEPRFWLALDPEAQEEFNRQAVTAGLIVLTEEPAEGQPGTFSITRIGGG